MRSAPLAAFLAAVVLAGCETGTTPEESGTAPTTTSAETTPVSPTSDRPTSEAPSSETPATGTASPDPSTSEDALPPWSTDAVEVTTDAGPVVAPQEITGVRTGVHDGFDRVVLDLTGDRPVLDWGARWVDEASQDPSGLPIDVEGPAYLQVWVRGIDWVTDSPDRYDGGTVPGDGTQVVTGVAFGGLFEGQQQIVIGLREQTAFRVFGLDDPARIVIDVRHP